MAHIVAFLFLVVAVATISAAPNCGENEEYTTCGSMCPGTCLKPVPSCPKDVCVMGCACKENHFRNVQNKCVPFLHCYKDFIRPERNRRL
ncbi:PREDICTED: chymotrypsin inhibitor-like [Vollenhovia emeryi]|uniref:chymotrypsin inhibitor-like n=1 Tax=Vollenhovia emeryi TaxID=411798 RepID=UPI0005F37DFA|nr:PREDICTED: chymotrypsin inhibitor-like [Vollenhovia emeryi]